MVSGAPRVCSEYHCEQSDHCIPYSWRCDGEEDCHYGEDEVNCTISECPSETHMRCTDNGQCIPNVWVCDGSYDCQNGLDEQNCTERQCAEGQFKCNNGVCIPSLLTCDGDPDCAGDAKEDESPDACRVGCTPDQGRFYCNSSNTCVWDFYRCDGWVVLRMYSYYTTRTLMLYPSLTIYFIPEYFFSISSSSDPTSRISFSSWFHLRKFSFCRWLHPSIDSFSTLPLFSSLSVLQEGEAQGNNFLVFMVLLSGSCFFPLKARVSSILTFRYLYPWYLRRWCILLSRHKYSIFFFSSFRYFRALFFPLLSFFMDVQDGKDCLFHLFSKKLLLNDAEGI